MSLIVVEPGLDSRLVDFGQPQTRSLGVPIGGAADRRSMALGNALLGNLPHVQALEVCLKGPVLRADAPTGAAFFGAPFPLSSNRQRLAPGKTFTLSEEEEIQVGSPPAGMRGYLCVRGGLSEAKNRGGPAGIENIKAGDVLSCEASAIRSRYGPALTIGFSGGTAEVHVVAGLQESWFDAGEFYGQEYSVTPALNRMGIRLRGKALTVPERELVSEPVGPGAVQVASDGQCIVLGLDGQTIGGYPKIAHVIQSDLDILGQLRPDDRVRFVKISQEEAAVRFFESRAWLREWVSRLHISLAGF